jgi:cytochrome c oxidase subunit 2
VLALAGCAGAPTYLHGYGPRAERSAELGWTLLAIASGVVLVVAALVLVGTLRRRGAATREVVRSDGGIRWIVVGGIIVPGVILLGVLVLAIRTLAATVSPPSEPALTVEVTGHRWWWEVRYPGSSPDAAFVTANEIHIPTGRPVRLELVSADVIHSFWVPQLAGKTDLIPGQRNVTWIQADSAGAYWGQCGEYCGQEHAKMGLQLVAESAADFDRWAARQRQPAAEPSEQIAVAGRDAFGRSACSLCHAIRGTSAGGGVGPDLTHLATRRTIAAGVLPNDRGNLTGWIASPQGFKPGVIMPAVPLTSRDLEAIVAYLETLE